MFEENTNISDFFNPSVILENNQDSGKVKTRDVNDLAEIFIQDPTDRNFETLMKILDAKLRHFCKTLVKMDDAVDDVMSRTMENVYFKRDTFNKESGRFSTWVFRIAFVNCIKYLNNEFDTKIPRRVDADLSDMGELTYNCVSSSFDIEDTDVEHLDMLYDNGRFIRFDNEAIFNEMYDSSLKSMENLPDKMKTIMKDRYINLKNVANIAKDNNYPLGTVKRLLMKGVDVLHDEIKSSYPEIFNIYYKSKMAV